MTISILTPAEPQTGLKGNLRFRDSGGGRRHPFGGRKRSRNSSQIPKQGLPLPPGGKITVGKGKVHGVKSLFLTK